MDNTVVEKLESVGITGKSLERIMDLNIHVENNIRFLFLIISSHCKACQTLATIFSSRGENRVLLFLITCLITMISKEDLFFKLNVAGQ